jgi:hypothetical protein
LKLSSFKVITISPSIILFFPRFIIGFFRLCSTKKIERGGEGRGGVLKLSSPPLHPNLEGTNSIDLKGRGGNFFPSPLHIKFYGANNKSNFLSPPIPSPPLPRDY